MIRIAALARVQVLLFYCDRIALLLKPGRYPPQYHFFLVPVVHYMVSLVLTVLGRASSF